MPDVKNLNRDQSSLSSGLSAAWNTGRHKQQNLSFVFLFR